MKDYRETVISVDQERMLLDRLLQEEDVSGHMTRPGNVGVKSERPKPQNYTCLQTCTYMMV